MTTTTPIPGSSSSLLPDVEWRPTDRFLDSGATCLAAYVNGVALFAYQSTLSRPGRPFFSCGVHGQMTCGGDTLEQAQAAGVAEARASGVRGADQRMSRAQFESLFAPVAEDALTSASTAAGPRPRRSRP